MPLPSGDANRIVDPIDDLGLDVAR